MVLFEISHDDCWSRLTSRFNINIRTIIAKSSKDRSYILGVDEVKAERYDDFKRFVRAFKSHNSVFEVNDIEEIDRRRNIYVLTFRERYDNMIMGIINNYDIFYLKDLITKGREKILLVLPSEEVYDFKGELSSIGELHYFKEKRVSFSDIFSPEFDLTNQERRIILEAIRRGYYDFPRKITLSELGKAIGVSKPTLEEYIRKTERKIMSKVAKTLQDYEYLFYESDNKDVRDG